MLMEYIYLDEYERIICNDNGLIYVNGTIELSDIYYGISSNTRINENFITSSFLKGVGNVGTISGKLYSFPTGYSYKYWCSGFSGNGSGINVDI